MKTRKTSREANQKALNITPLTQSVNQKVHTQRGDGLGTRILYAEETNEKYEYRTKYTHILYMKIEQNIYTHII